MSEVNEFLAENNVEVFRESGFFGWMFRKGEKSVRVSDIECPYNPEPRVRFIIDRIKDIL